MKIVKEKNKKGLKVFLNHIKILVIALFLSCNFNYVDDSVVIMSYKFYPVPFSYSKEITVYINNKEDHVFYHAKYDFNSSCDTFFAPLNSKLTTQYYIDSNKYIDSLIVKSENVRWLIGN